MSLNTLQDILCAVDCGVNQIFIDAGRDISMEWRSRVEDRINAFDSFIKATFLLEIFNNDLNR